MFARLSVLPSVRVLAKTFSDQLTSLFHVLYIYDHNKVFGVKKLFDVPYVSSVLPLLRYNLSKACNEQLYSSPSDREKKTNKQKQYTINFKI